MPVVPISAAQRSRSFKGQALPMRPPPEEPFALMAAAVMHQEGRLIEGSTPSVEASPK